MKVLVTGHHGYIGSVMTDVLARAGHEVTGLDTYLYEGATSVRMRQPVPSIRKDIRDVEPADLRGFDAVIHLAALSNDPLGCLDESCTYDINHLGSVSLARAAKAAGVPRFLFASSCSLYGAAGDDAPRRDARRSTRSPPTARPRCWSRRTSRSWRTTRSARRYLRNATAYGASPRLRADIVVNNLVGVAYTTGEVLIQSDGTPWRPLVHIQDISRAFLAVLEAPREAIHNRRSTSAASEENYQIRDVADDRAGDRARLHREVPGGRRPGSALLPRQLRQAVARTFPASSTEWTVRRGVEELYASFVRHGLTREMFAAYVRLKRIQGLLSDGRLDAGAAVANASVATV